jgi:hypothetical protein
MSPFWIEKMTTNVPSYQNGVPYPIDNLPPPKSLISRQKTSFSTVRESKSVTIKFVKDPKTSADLLKNVEASLAGFV